MFLDDDRSVNKVYISLLSSHYKEKLLILPVRSD